MAYTWSAGPFSQDPGEKFVPWTITFPQYPGSQVIVPLVTTDESTLEWGPMRQSLPPHGEGVYQVYVIDIRVVPGPRASRANFYLSGMAIG